MKCCALDVKPGELMYVQGKVCVVEKVLSYYEAINPAQNCTVRLATLFDRIKHWWRTGVWMSDCK